ncbi:MAG TPA: hypothetical protein VK610_08900 [Rhodothermales bacterium]|nr:hypothetical protein [Rhodothermales bacterium]
MSTPPSLHAPPPGYPAYPPPPGGYPPPRGGSNTPLVIGGVVVLIALIVAVVFVMTQREPGGAVPAQSAGAPVAPPSPGASSEAPTVAIAPTSPGQAPATAAAPTPTAPAPTPAAPAATPSGTWSTAAPDLGQDCSLPGGVPVTIEIVNRLSVSLQLFWTAEDCSSQHYATLAPGETISQSTYTRHRWDVGDGELAYAAFIPNGSSNRWVIQ